MRLQALKPTLSRLPASQLQTINPDSWRAGKGSSAERGYDAAWRRRRAKQLQAHPLCVYCEQDGKTTAATVADHITPHRGDPELFRGPLQSLCAQCHSSRKAKEEAAARRGG